jgi:hypothetical protein
VDRLGGGGGEAETRWITSCFLPFLCPSSLLVCKGDPCPEICAQRMLGVEDFLCLGLHAGTAAGFLCLSFLSTYPFCKRDENKQTYKEANDKNGWTVLHYAAGSGHGTVVSVLVETLGVDMEAKDSNNSTALHAAAWNGHETMVRMFVETFGINKEAKDRSWLMALHFAAGNG